MPIELTKEQAKRALGPADALCSSDGPSIYIGFWGLYNQGNLYGNWCDLEIASTREEIEDCIQFLRDKHGDQNATDEWMVQDHCMLPQCLHGENPDLDQIELFMTTWLELHEDEQEAYLLHCNNEGSVVDEESFRDAFYGVHESPEAFAEDFFESRDEGTGSLAPYIDWERVWEGEFNCAGWYGLKLEGGEWAIFCPR